MDNPLPNIDFHRHTGIDAPKVSVNDLEDAYTGTTAVKLTGDQTVAGIKTFSSIPVLPASNPTTDNQAVRKAYVDSRFADTEDVASDNLRDSADTQRSTSSTSYTKLKEIELNDVGGVIRVKFGLLLEGASQNAYGRIYKNGVAFGTERSTPLSVEQTYSEDLAFATGDLIQLYAHKNVGGNNAIVRNFQLYYDKVFTVVVGTVNQD